MVTRKAIRVEVVLGLPERQQLMSVEIAADTSCDEAISLSGIYDSFPDLDLAEVPVAIWGRPVNRDHPLKEGDRIEMLRPLAIDPREARRKRALVGQFMGGVNGGLGEDS